LLFKTTRFPTTTFGKDKKERGRFLLEKKVVILIIGILTSVALPPYQLAVMKARYAEMMTVADSFKVCKSLGGMWTANYDGWEAYALP